MADGDGAVVRKLISRIAAAFVHGDERYAISIGK